MRRIEAIQLSLLFYVLVKPLHLRPGNRDMRLSALDLKTSDKLRVSVRNAP